MNSLLKLSLSLGIAFGLLAAPVSGTTVPVDTPDERYYFEVETNQWWRETNGSCNPDGLDKQGGSYQGSPCSADERVDPTDACGHDFVYPASVCTNSRGVCISSKNLRRCVSTPVILF